MNIKEMELHMWDAVKEQNAAAFLQLVDEDAVMVCGGYRCSGREYSGIISEFDLASYEISNYEVITETDTICQIHYVIETKVAQEKNKDLEGRFHITSTWKNGPSGWKLVFNMDSEY